MNKMRIPAFRQIMAVLFCGHCIGREKVLPCLSIYFITLFMAGCQGTFPTKEHLESPRIGQQAYTLGPGDKVRINVYEHEGLSGIFSVDDSGRISLPLIQGINVGGLTLPALEKIVTQHLVDNQIVDPKVSVDLIQLRSVCILGEVNLQGCFTYVYGLTVNKAIALAGGYTNRANREKFIITREESLSGHQGSFSVIKRL